MSLSLSRRTLARLLGGPNCRRFLPPRFGFSEGQPSRPSSARSFPAGFFVGISHGVVPGGRRGEGRWKRTVDLGNTFSHTAGKTFNGDTGDVADDFYHRYLDDIRLMKDLGLKAFRFSISWSRVFPNGTGAPNPKGLDFYNKLVDALLAAGVQPYCTLFHWDLPQTLGDNGGWQNRATSEAFGEYAGYVAKHFSDSHPILHDAE